MAKSNHTEEMKAIKAQHSSELKSVRQDLGKVLEELNITKRINEE